MLLQALHENIKMKNVNFQVTLLVHKGVGTRSRTKKCGTGHFHSTTTLKMTQISLINGMNAVNVCTNFSHCKLRHKIRSNLVLKSFLSKSFQSAWGN